MIYDCSSFFDELEVLEIRLHELSPIVDKFVIVEGSTTFSGVPRELVLKKLIEEKNEVLAPFLDKIIYIPVEDIPNETAFFARETYIMNQISRGLKQCVADDIIILEYGDQIVSKATLEKIFLKELYNYQEALENSYLWFNLVWSLYYLNNLASIFWIHGSVMYKYKNIKTPIKALHVDGGTHVPNNSSNVFTNHGGWHFSWLGGEARELKRRDASSHRGSGPENLYGIHVREQKVVPITEDTFPKYLVENQQRFKHLIR